MFPLQIPGVTPGELPRCEKNPDPIQKADETIKEAIDHAIWKDNILRALDYEIGIHVKNGVVHLNGHILNIASNIQIENAIKDIPGILEIKNDLVLDDKLNLEVAVSLGKLEHTYDCKFFTGTSRGVVSLNGIVSAEHVKLLAEKCAADNPNVRGVINNVRISGALPDLHDQPFLQPTIGEAIYFLDGISGIVKQVIINPNNRRVIAMTVRGKFTDQRQDLKYLNSGKARLSERVIILRMSVVRYLTRVSGFLYISSHEKNRYMDFDRGYFMSPDKNWTPPYPYCRDDVLFPIEFQDEEKQIMHAPNQNPFAAVLEDISFKKQFVANDSYGGYDEE